MDTTATPGPLQMESSKTVQQYIDELPAWSDGTRLKTSPMTGMQWRIWSLAATGKFFEGYVVFMTGVALPLITRQFNIPAGVNGIISAASLAGILFGSVLLGGLSDVFGRKRMFIAEMILFCAFLALLLLCTGYLSLAICLFGLGLALGCDYPTAHMIISETVPSTARGKLVLGAFAFQALGALGYYFTNSLSEFYAIAALFGFTYAGVMPLYAVLARENFPLRMMGTIIGGSAMAGSLGMATGPVLGGWIFDTTGGYGWLYIASFGMGLGAAAIALLFKPFPHIDETRLSLSNQ